MFGKKCLLIINENEKRELEEQLHDLGLGVTTAINSKKHKLKETKKTPPDIVILQNIETLHIIDQLLPELNVPVLYLFDKLSKKMDELDNLEYLYAPYTNRELYQAIHICIYKFKAEKEQRKLMVEKQKKAIQVAALLNASALINSSLNIDVIQKRTLEVASTLIDGSAACLLFKQNNKSLDCSYAINDTPKTHQAVTIDPNSKISRWITDNPQITTINDPKKDKNLFHEISKIIDNNVTNLLSVPVMRNNVQIGFLLVVNKSSGDFNQEDTDLLTAFSHHIAVAIDNHKLYLDLKETLYSIILAFAETTEKKDPYTAGHTKRVQEYSVAIGKHMGLNDTQLERVKVAALLHDIGKIGISDKVLMKPSNLTDEEFLEIQNHPQFGAEIIKHIKGFQDIIPAIKQHHERFNGSGYPDLLEGDQIDPIARIIAVADVFDAMTTNRPYRKGLTPKETLLDICKKSGRDFDPEVVTAFMKVWENVIDFNL